MRYSCRCLNVKLHLASEAETVPSGDARWVGEETNIRVCGQGEVGVAGLVVAWPQLVQRRETSQGWMVLRCYHCGVDVFAERRGAEAGTGDPAGEGTTTAPPTGHLLVNTAHPEASWEAVEAEPKFSEVFGILMDHPDDDLGVGEVRDENAARMLAMLQDRVDSRVERARQEMEARCRAYVAAQKAALAEYAEAAHRDRQILWRRMCGMYLVDNEWWNTVPDERTPSIAGSPNRRPVQIPRSRVSSLTAPASGRTASAIAAAIANATPEPGLDEDAPRPEKLGAADDDCSFTSRASTLPPSLTREDSLRDHPSSLHSSDSFLDTGVRVGGDDPASHTVFAFEEEEQDHTLDPTADMMMEGIAFGDPDDLSSISSSDDDQPYDVYHRHHDHTPHSHAQTAGPMAIDRQSQSQTASEALVGTSVPIQIPIPSSLGNGWHSLHDSAADQIIVGSINDHLGGMLPHAEPDPLVPGRPVGVARSLI